MELSHEHTKNLYKALLAFLIILSVYFGIKALAELRSYGRMGSQNVNTISSTGHGEVTAVPDVANIYFTIRKEMKTVKDAQAAVAVVEKSALEFLKTNNVAEKDIKTSNASFNPKYEYTYTDAVMMPCTQYGCPPRPGKNVITGYEAYESITVKVRNTDDVGKIMQGLGTIGVSDLSGPNFAIDDEDTLKVEARKLAIDDAKEKAEMLAEDLGVSLGRIASFSESGNYYPIMYGKGAMMSEDSATAPALAEVPKGENTISSDVTITYEIR